MLRYFQDKPEEMERYDISTSTIALSILLAFSHAILESIFLYMEA